jgi:hypothetical protein
VTVFSTGKIVIDTENSPVIKLSDICETIKYIPLQTTNECLIGNIDKIIFANDRFYILDKELAKAIFVFEYNGDFAFKVGNLGLGPGEYSSINDFVLNSLTETIEVMSGLNILKYDMSGKYLTTMKLELPISAENFEILQNGNYLLSTCYTPSRFYIFQPDGKKFWEGMQYLNVNQNIPLIDKKSISKTTDYVAVKIFISDTIYHFYPDNMIDKIPIDFCGHNAPPEKFLTASDFSTLQNELYDSDYVALADFFTETDSLCYFFIILNKNGYSAYISKHSKNVKIYFHGLLVDPFYSTFPLTNIGHNKLVYCVPMSELIDNFTEEKIKELASEDFLNIYKQSNTDSNPVLMIATIKDF